MVSVKYTVYQRRYTFWGKFQRPFLLIILAYKGFTLLFKFLARQAIFIYLFIFCLLISSYPANAGLSSLKSTAGLTNFAFASYLGTGFYVSSGQKVFVIQLPFDHTIKQKTDTEAGWVLKLPVTFGLLDFNGLESGNLPNLNQVGTLTFLPGIEYQYPVTPEWTVIPFGDYGFARDLNNKTNILVTGFGIKSYVKINHKGNQVTLGNKILYATEHSKNSDQNPDYALIETGLDYQIHTELNAGGRNIDLSFYYINYYYPNNLIFLAQTKNPIRVGSANEVGFSIANLPDFLFLKKPRLGFGVRISSGVTVYRLLYGLPF